MFRPKISPCYSQFTSTTNRSRLLLWPPERIRSQKDYWGARSFRGSLVASSATQTYFSSSIYPPWGRNLSLGRCSCCSWSSTVATSCFGVIVTHPLGVTVPLQGLMVLFVLSPRRIASHHAWIWSTVSGNFLKGSFLVHSGATNVETRMQPMYYTNMKINYPAWRRLNAICCYLFCTHDFFWIELWAIDSQSFFPDFTFGSLNTGHSTIPNFQIHIQILSIL